MQLVDAARAALAAHQRLSAQRRRVAACMFHDPGHATARAVALAYEAMDMDETTIAPFVPARVPQRTSAGVSR